MGLNIRNVDQINAEGNEVSGATRIVFEFEDSSQVPNIDELLEKLPNEFRNASVTIEGPCSVDGLVVDGTPIVLQAPEEKRHNGPSL